MPEDLKDKLDDFELMLEGFCADLDETRQKNRLLSYWYSLKGEMEKEIDK